MQDLNKSKLKNDFSVALLTALLGSEQSYNFEVLITLFHNTNTSKERVETALLHCTYCIPPA
jgi:hypothetical protein